MTYRFLILILGLFIVLTSCEKPEEEIIVNNSINKIMPLGASRVEGATPVFESYRYELWKMLVQGGWEFDYIGTMEDEGQYADFSDKSFDADHEGRGGWTSGQILSGIEGWIEVTGAPDIVLFSSPGGNDALQGLPYEDAVDNVNAIIDIIQAANPNATILIEQLAPALSSAMTPELTTYFNQMNMEVLSIATNQSTSTSEVIPVDMYSQFTDGMLADDVHYNQEGAVFIASQYYDVLTNVLQP